MNVTIPAEAIPVAQACGESTRYALKHAQLEKNEEGVATLTATDGRMLLSAEWPTGDREPTESALLVHGSVLKGKKRINLYEGDDSYTTETLGTTGAPTGDRLESKKGEGLFPGWRGVVPDRTTHTLELNIDPVVWGKWLTAVGRMLTAERWRNGYRPRARLLINPHPGQGNDSAVLLLADAPNAVSITGLAMPCNPPERSRS